MIENFLEAFERVLLEHMEYHEFNRILFDTDQFLNALEPEKRAKLHNLIVSNRIELFLEDWLQEIPSGGLVSIFDYPILMIDSSERQYPGLTNIQLIVSVVRRRLKEEREQNKRRW